MGILIVIAATLCPVPKILPCQTCLGERGLKEMETAKESCKKYYGPDSCLVEFEVVSERWNKYYATCQTFKKER